MRADRTLWGAASRERKTEPSSKAEFVLHDAVASNPAVGDVEDVDLVDGAAQDSPPSGSHSLADPQGPAPGLTC
jgi:hypothetical protein